MLQYFGIQHLELACGFPGLLQSWLCWMSAGLWSKVGPCNSLSQCAKGVTEDSPHGNAFLPPSPALDNTSVAVALMDFK